MYAIGWKNIYANVVFVQIRRRANSSSDLATEFSVGS